MLEQILFTVAIYFLGIIFFAIQRLIFYEYAPRLLVIAEFLWSCIPVLGFVAELALLIVRCTEAEDAARKARLCPYDAKNGKQYPTETSEFAGMVPRNNFLAHWLFNNLDWNYLTGKDLETVNE